jgi:hypothetical protein
VPKIVRINYVRYDAISIDTHVMKILPTRRIYKSMMSDENRLCRKQEYASMMLQQCMDELGIDIQYVNFEGNEQELIITFSHLNEQQNEIYAINLGRYLLNSYKFRRLDFSLVILDKDGKILDSNYLTGHEVINYIDRNVFAFKYAKTNMLQDYKELLPNLIYFICKYRRNSFYSKSHQEYRNRADNFTAKYLADNYPLEDLREASSLLQRRIATRKGFASALFFLLLVTAGAGCYLFLKIDRLQDLQIIAGAVWTGALLIKSVVKRLIDMSLERNEKRLNTVKNALDRYKDKPRT